MLREARIGYTGLVIRDLTVEVRIREESDFQTALTKLRELSQPLGGLLSATGPALASMWSMPATA